VLYQGILNAEVKVLSRYHKEAHEYRWNLHQ